MRRTEEDIIRLIDEYPESEWLDFKADYYCKEKKADMVHDILCMANSDHNDDRFIICGVSNNKEVVGLSISIPDNQFWTDIRSFPTNYTLPVIYYELEVCTSDRRVRVGVIQIESSDKKPFYLTKDFSRNGKMVRAGVPYSRDSSNNTPINGCPHDAEIERMWRIRFGLDLDPLARVLKLIREPNHWMSSEAPPEYEGIIRYHRQFPQFTLDLRLQNDIPNGEFWEPWIERIRCDFQKAGARQTSVWLYYLKYHNTILKTGQLMHPRHTIMPLPQTASSEEYVKDAKEMKYILQCDTDEYFVSAICVDDRYEHSSPTGDRLTKLDYRILEDVQVMFGSDAFELEQRGD